VKTVRVTVKTWATVRADSSSTWNWRFKNPRDDGSWSSGDGCPSEDAAKRAARKALYVHAQNWHNADNPNTSDMEVILL